MKNLPHLNLTGGMIGAMMEGLSRLLAEIDGDPIPRDEYTTGEVEVMHRALEWLRDQLAYRHELKAKRG